VWKKKKPPQGPEEQDDSRLAWTYNTIREPMAKIATEVCASVYAPESIRQGIGHVFALAHNQRMMFTYAYSKEVSTGEATQ
jgi:hypothetical protein